MKMVKCYKSVYELGVIDALLCVIDVHGQIIAELTPVIEGFTPLLMSLRTLWVRRSLLLVFYSVLRGCSRV